MDLYGVPTPLHVTCKVTTGTAGTQAQEQVWSAALSLRTWVWDSFKELPAGGSTEQSGAAGRCPGRAVSP